MQRLLLVRTVQTTPPPSAKQSAKVIELRIRREASRAQRRSHPDRPDAA
jgi:hypothetical protein